MSNIQDLYTQKAQLEKEIEKLEQDKSYNEGLKIIEYAQEKELKISFSLYYSSGNGSSLSNLIMYDMQGKPSSIAYANAGQKSGSFIVRNDGEGLINIEAIPSNYTPLENEVSGSAVASHNTRSRISGNCTNPILRSGSCGFTRISTAGYASIGYTFGQMKFSKIAFNVSAYSSFSYTISIGEEVFTSVSGAKSGAFEIPLDYFETQAHKDLKLKEITDTIAAKTQELNQTLESINTILQNAAAELEASKAELEQKQQELTQKQEELAQKEAENEAVLKEIESLKAQEAQLQEQIKQLEEQIAQAGSADNEELESLKQSIAELEAAKIQKEQELQNANANLESLKAKKAELESQIAELEAQAQELQEQINLHNQEIPKLETRKHYAELKIPENEALLEQKKQEYKELAEAINALDAEIKALSDEIKAKEAEITTLRAEKTGLEEQKENLAEMIEQKEQELSGLKEEIEQLKQEIAQQEQKLSELKELFKERDDLLAYLEQLKKEIEELEGQRLTLNDELFRIIGEIVIKKRKKDFNLDEIQKLQNLGGK
ncbi:hypothetical protein [Helicobacter pullorum]|uniref:hypothetical protein n=1 Tax=Helicobacter pullorum TaxID=35818 RepID=UPI001DEB689D|nr:hypothetical protein [Helicobacter pullorum]HJF82877.1 hypothetical protein [Helicobacter pullorum]